MTPIADIERLSLLRCDEAPSGMPVPTATMPCPGQGQGNEAV
jgi:hypothetical protein